MAPIRQRFRDQQISNVIPTLKKAPRPECKQYSNNETTKKSFMGSYVCDGEVAVLVDLSHCS